MTKKYVYNYILDEGNRGEDEGHIMGCLNHCPDDSRATPEEAEVIQEEIIERLKNIITDDMQERFVNYFENKNLVRTEIEAKPQLYGKVIDFTLFFVEDMGEYGEFSDIIFVTLFWLY